MPPSGAGAETGWWEGISEAGEGEGEQIWHARVWDGQRPPLLYPNSLPKPDSLIPGCSDFCHLNSWGRSESPHRVGWGVTQAKGKNIFLPQGDLQLAPN